MPDSLRLAIVQALLDVDPRSASLGVLAKSSSIVYLARFIEAPGAYESVFTLLERLVVWECQNTPPVNMEETGGLDTWGLLTLIVPRFGEYDSFPISLMQAWVSLLDVLENACSNQSVGMTMYSKQYLPIRGILSLWEVGEDSPGFDELPQYQIHRQLIAQLALILVQSDQEVLYGSRDYFPPDKTFTDLFQRTRMRVADIARLWSTGGDENLTQAHMKAQAIEPSLMTYLALYFLDPLRETALCPLLPDLRVLVDIYASNGDGRLLAREFWRDDGPLRIIAQRCIAMYESLEYHLGRLRPLLPLQDEIFGEQIAAKFVVNRFDLLGNSVQLANMLRPNRFTQIEFMNEVGVDMGGLLREWYSLVIQELMDVNTGLFELVEGTQNTYTVRSYRDPASMPPRHAELMLFAGKLVGRAIIDEQQLGVSFSNSVYKHLMERPVELADLESDDPALYNRMQWLLKNNETTVDGFLDVLRDMSFTCTVIDNGTPYSVDLIEAGSSITVTPDNKGEDVNALVEYRLARSVENLIAPFVAGFQYMIPADVITQVQLPLKIFDLIVAGTPVVDVEDLIENMAYFDRYTLESEQIQWLLAELRSYTEEELRMFLSFVTGSEQTPLGGFTNLKDSRGDAKVRIKAGTLTTGPDDTQSQLPVSHTCFCTLDLPAYASRQELALKLKQALIFAHKGFGLS